MSKFKSIIIIAIFLLIGCNSLQAEPATQNLTDWEFYQKYSSTDKKWDNYIKEGFYFYERRNERDAYDALLNAEKAGCQDGIMYYRIGFILDDVIKNDDKAFGYYQKALQYFQKIDGYHRYYSYAHMGLGKIYSNNDQKDLSIKEFQASINSNRNPNDPTPYIGYANFCRFCDPDKRIEAFDKALEISPSNISLIIDKGVLLNNVGEFKAARRYLLMILDKYKNSLNDYALKVINFNLTYARKRQDDYLPKTEMEKDNGNFTHVEKGRYYIRSGNHDNAISEFHKAIEKGEDKVEAHYWLGFSLQAKNNFNEAIKEFQTVLLLLEDNIYTKEMRSNAYYYLGIIYRELNEFDLAIENLNKSIEIDPVDLGYAHHYNLGITYEKMGEFEKALEAYETGIKIEYSKVMEDKIKSVKTILSKAYYTSSDKNEISKDTNEESKPYNHLKKGELFLDRDDYDNAIEEFNKAIKKDSNNAEAYYRLGFCLRVKKNLNQAIEAFQKVIFLTEQDEFKNEIRSDSYRYLGLIYSDLNKFDQAIENFNKAIDIPSVGYSSYLNLGEMYEKMKEFTKAKEVYETGQKKRYSKVLENKIKNLEKKIQNQKLETENNKKVKNTDKNRLTAKEKAEMDKKAAAEMKKMLEEMNSMSKG